MITIFDFFTVLALALVAVLAGLALREVREHREESIRLGLFRLFGPARERAMEDPRQLIVWYPLGRAARRLWPDSCRALDRALGETFPFSRDHVERAHARWTAAWLAWERSHDREFKARIAGLVERAKIEAAEQEKLERYQQRYEEYVQVAKALAALEPVEG